HDNRQPITDTPFQATRQPHFPYPLPMRALKSIAAFFAYFIVAIGVQWVIQYAVFKSGIWKPANGFSALDFIISDRKGIIAVTIVAWAAARIEKRRVTDYGLPPSRSAVPH